MSLVQNTSVYQDVKESADRKQSEFWVALALLCAVALALVAAGAVAAPAAAGSGINSETLRVGP